MLAGDCTSPLTIMKFLIGGTTILSDSSRVRLLEIFELKLKSPDTLPGKFFGIQDH